MYKFELPSEIVKNLWQIREFCGGGSLVGQVREAVKKHILDKEKEIGCPISDVQEAREEHQREEAELSANEV